MTESMELFWMHTVKPSIECEPGHGLKESYLNKLVDFLSAEPGTSSKDLELVRQICTGKIQRHPVLHGVAFRSFSKSFIFCHLFGKTLFCKFVNYPEAHRCIDEN